MFVDFVPPAAFGTQWDQLKVTTDILLNATNFPLFTKCINTKVIPGCNFFGTKLFGYKAPNCPVDVQPVCLKLNLTADANVVSGTSVLVIAVQRSFAHAAVIIITIGRVTSQTVASAIIVTCGNESFANRSLLDVRFAKVGCARTNFLGDVSISTDHDSKISTQIVGTDGATARISDRCPSESAPDIKEAKSVSVPPRAGITRF
jgi:hypothetical protein